VGERWYERSDTHEVWAISRMPGQGTGFHDHGGSAGAFAVLVDIRPAAQRVQEGEIPGALIVERNVLEWRFDPASDARLAAATGYELHLIIVCSEGYTSSLAAASLQDLGLFGATDIIGGFHAWRAAGLPTIPART
jgi:rhodanese-related sulfurtransferase